MKKPFIILVLAFLATSPSLAATQYVTDQIKITLRSGQSTEHKVMQMLESGMAVEVLSADEETGYSHVRMPGGTTGYVLTRLLTATPSARERLATAEQRLAELQQEPEKLASKLAALQQEYEDLNAKHQEIGDRNNRLQSELQEIKQTATDAVNIANERNMLRKRVAALNGELGELKLENHDLRNQSERKWFLMGAGVIIIGILLGLILPRLRFRRRRDTWGSLSGY